MLKGLFNNIFDGLTTFVTGHTGFKGSWLATWLVEMGANVVGFSLAEPPTVPSNFELSGLGGRITDVRGDVRDLEQLREAVEIHQPELIFHLAAQPIVLRSFEQPRITFDTNAGGTVNVLEAVRTTNSVRALVSITTDKVYEDQGWLWGYRENDRLGGYEPYSASKAMAELAIASYRQSFFPPERYAEHGVAIASARAGNVIGGGDFAAHRLVPDSMGALAAGETIQIRNPLSVRPWQYVLEPLSGYLLLAAKLLNDGAEYAESWNYGPKEKQGVSTQELVEKLIELWGLGRWLQTQKPGDVKKETEYLRLNWDKAAALLGWQPVYSLEETLAEITVWYRAYQSKSDMLEVGREQIGEYVRRAEEMNLNWAQ